MRRPKHPLVSFDQLKPHSVTTISVFPSMMHSTVSLWLASTVPLICSLINCVDNRFEVRPLVHPIRHCTCIRFLFSREFLSFTPFAYQINALSSKFDRCSQQVTSSSPSLSCPLLPVNSSLDIFPSSLVMRMTVLPKVLYPHGLAVTGDINCDTSDKVSLVYRLRSLNSHQMAAGSVNSVKPKLTKLTLLSLCRLFIVSLMTLVMTSTVLHLHHLLTDSNAIRPLVSSFSILSATEKLFWAKGQTHEVTVFETFRNLLVVGGSVTHALLCVEIPLGFYLLGQLMAA